jgi:hypothetical protein
MAEEVVINSPVTITGLLRPLGGVAGVGGAAVGTLAVAKRVRCTAAAINAPGGATLLNAIPYARFALVDWTLVAIGGNASGGAVRLTATQNGVDVQLASVPANVLDAGRPVKPSTNNVTTPADGSAYAAADRNTPLRLTNASSLGGATAIDAILTFQVEFQLPS